MYLLLPNGDGKQMVNLAVSQLLVIRQDRLSLGTHTLLGNQKPEELKARFADILEALQDGKLVVYDYEQPVGYWKPKTKATPKKPAESAE